LKNKIKNIFDKYNITISDTQIDDFIVFNDMLLKYNSIHNLTNITEEDEMIVKHYLDSVLPYNIFKKNSKVIDLGCGGGFPSIPLKIINKTLDFTAVDSVTKKTEFVNLASNELKFEDFNVIHTRIEDLAHNINYREQYDYVISRAVAPLNIILEYSAPFAKKDGYVICYKGSKYKEEIENATNALKTLNCKIEEIKEFYIEEIDAYRYILIIKKLDTTNKKYPRKQNKPRIQPL